MSEEDERVTLAGLDPEEALKALLAVDPDAPAEQDEKPSDSPSSADEDE